MSKRPPASAPEALARPAKRRADVVASFGPAERPRAREMAAVLSCGSDAVVSHRSAAVLWGLLPSRRDIHPIQLSLPRDLRRKGRIHTHRVRNLPECQVTRVEGIPATIPPRTLLDLAAQGSRRELERALAQVEREGLTDRREVQRLASRTPTRPGVPTLLALLEVGHKAAFTRSEAEERLLSLVRSSGLPHPTVNFEVAGFEVIRVTWRQLTEERDATLVLLAQALVRAESRA